LYTNAQKSIMGGNTYNRRHFTDNELSKLLLKINKWQSLFDSRIFDSEKTWRANISRHLDADSCNRFYFMIEQLKGLPACRACLTTLTINSFSYSGDIKGFHKYCPECTKKGVWRLVENYTPSALKERGTKITQRKLNFYQSDKGKLTAKDNGTKISAALKQFHTTDAGKLAREKSSEHNSQIMRSKILSGEFTPNSNNRNTHWKSEFNGKRYRSSWEAVYQYFNPLAEYEMLRIPYTFDNKNLIYIVDFIDHVNKVVTEVKPAEMISDTKTSAKLLALEKWADQNNYTVNIFTLDSIKTLQEPEYGLFDNETIRKLKKIYATIKN